MKKKIFIVAAVFISSQSQAQTTIAPLVKKDSSKTLDEIVFTANKYPQKQSTTGKVLTVINQNQLEKNSGRTLAQVLNEQAGLVVNGSQNTLGTNQYVFMRGASTPNTLILVDGVPATEASGISGEFDINQFAIDQIERVEILKGAQSVMYGSDAVAGVINIITKKYKGSKKVALNGGLAGGTYGTFKGNAGITGKVNIVSYNFNYSRLQSNGFSSAYDVTGNNNFDDDGFKQDVLGLNVAAAITKNWQLRLFGQYGKYKTDIDDEAFTDDKNSTVENKNVQAGLASVYQFKKGSVNVNLNLNNSDHTFDDLINDPVVGINDYDPFNAVYKGRSIFAEAFTNLTLHKHIGLLAGVDFRNNKANIESTYGQLGDDSLKAHLVSGYASVFLKDVSGFSAELGGRITNHSSFGSAFTYSFNPSYLINKQVKVFANIASGFRAPTIYNLASEYGNKDLKPEKSVSIEGGLQWINIKNTANLRFTYFNRSIKDVIVFKSLFVAPYGQYANADKQKDHGIELEAIVHPCAKWNITANYSFVDGKIETNAGGKDTSFYNLYRRPKNTVNITVGFQASSKLYASIGGRWVDKRADQFYNADTYETEKKVLGDYYNLDAYISYQPLRFIKIFVDARNVTDQQYFDLYGINTRKFNFMAGVTFNF